MNVATTPPASSTVSALQYALERLEEMIDEETAALESNQPIDLDDIIRRKSRSLLELTRIVRALPEEGVAGSMRPDVARLRGRLIHNQDLLKIHLGAVQEISALISGVLREAESDGTYSLATATGGAR